MSDPPAPKRKGGNKGGGVKKTAVVVKVLQVEEEEAEEVALSAGKSRSVVKVASSSSSAGREQNKNDKIKGSTPSSSSHKSISRLALLTEVQLEEISKRRPRRKSNSGVGLSSATIHYHSHHYRPKRLSEFFRGVVRDPETLKESHGRWKVHRKGLMSGLQVAFKIAVALFVATVLGICVIFGSVVDLVDEKVEKIIPPPQE